MIGDIFFWSVDYFPRHFILYKKLI